MRPSINILMEHTVGKTGSWRSRRAFLAQDEELTKHDETDDWYDFLTRHEWCFVGTPDFVVERLKRFQADLGCEHLVLYWALPALNIDMVTASIKLFANKVMPCF
jgi:alkanesulfonate monooxygenase SsuD/methylene tetrahydromethanopterin reductase-like flavin-dependent oxidoreductase (luciferase family)